MGAVAKVREQRRECVPSLPRLAGSPFWRMKVCGPDDGGSTFVVGYLRIARAKECDSAEVTSSSLVVELFDIETWQDKASTFTRRPPRPLRHRHG
jgi:hypothetical protein